MAQVTELSVDEFYELQDRMENCTESERMDEILKYFPTLKIRTSRMGESGKGANKYRVTVINEGDQFTVTFTDSLYNTWKDKKSSKFEMLYSIIVDAQCYEQSRTFEEFCDSVCYDLEDKRARKCYEGCRRTFENIERLFSYDGYEILNAITFGY